MTVAARFRCEDFWIRTASGVTTQPLSFALGLGDSVALVGGAGAGKSLLFEKFSGIERPGVESGGRFDFGRTATVPQDARLVALPTDRVWSLLGFSGLGVLTQGLVSARWPASASEDRARALMKLLLLDPDRLAELSFRDLSATERRGVLICRALLQDPEVLLLDGWDEMTDGPRRRATGQLLRERMRSGMSVLLTSRRYPLRDFPEAAVVDVGTEDFGEPAVPLIATATRGKPHDHALLELTRVSVNRPRFSLFRPRPPAVPVDGASLFVRHGEALVLLGIGGAGKTTLLQTIAGLHSPSRGAILASNHDVTYARGRRARRLRKNVQLVFQDATSALDGNRTVQSHLDEALALAPPESHSPAQWLERVGLSPRLLRAPADQLSASEGQRVDLARSLVVSPQLVLFDAPEVSAADTDGGVLAALLSAEKARGRAFLIATTDPDVARNLADRVAIIHAGRIIELGTKNEVLSHPGHPVTQALLEGGDVTISDPTAPCRGCPHTPKCSRRGLPQCDEQEPMLAPIIDPEDVNEDSAPGQHRVACFHPIDRR